MFHPDTQFLIDHWAGLAVGAGMPEHARFKPERLRARLNRALMAVRSGDDAVIRLAGEWIENLHGRGLALRPASSLWRASSQALAAQAQSRAVREGRPMVISALAGADQPLEVVIAPLRASGGRSVRLLMLFSPLATLALPADETRLLTARLVAPAGVGARPALNLATVDGRRVA